jgi:hypothetical protein
MSTKEIRVSWSAPHAWPKFETVTGLPPLPRRPGVYLWTFEYRDGYLIYLAGETGLTFGERMGQHSLEYMAGRYSIFDLVQAKNGVRSELWQGFLWKARPSEKVAEWKAREAACRKLPTGSSPQCGLFVADVESASKPIGMGQGQEEQRTRQRLEAAMMNRLYADAAPLPDKGMFLARSLEGEQPITVLNVCASKLYGLPKQLPLQPEKNTHAAP